MNTRRPDRPPFRLASTAILAVALAAAGTTWGADGPSRPLRGDAAHDKARWLESATRMPSPVVHLLEGAIDAEGRTQFKCRGVSNPGYREWRERFATHAGRAR